MKIRHPLLIRAASRLGAWTLRGWIGTLRYRYVPLGAHILPGNLGCQGRYLYVFWHEHMLLPAYHYARPDVRVLISTHADGQLIAEICARLGLGLVRGSSTRGGVRAVRDIMHERATHFVVTPDGPRGPRRRAQPGIAFLASRTGLPVVPVGVGYDRPWRLKSWDQFCLPKPGRRALIVTDEPIRVPADADRGTLEHYRAQIELALNEVADRAERWATRSVPREYRRSRPKAV